MPMRSAGPGAGDGRRGGGRHRVRGARDREDRVEVDLRADRLAHGRHARLRVADLGRRHEAEVALDHAEPRLVPDRAEHRDAREALDGRAKLRLVARAAHAIEDDARDAHGRVEGGEPVQQRGGAARHPAGIQHQDHRKAEPRARAPHCCPSRPGPCRREGRGCPRPARGRSPRRAWPSTPRLRPLPAGAGRGCGRRGPPPCPATAGRCSRGPS